MRARVAELLGPRPPSPPLAARVLVVPAGDRSLHLTLVIDPDGVPRERSLEASSCDELVQATALILALAIEPELDAATRRWPEAAGGDSAALPSAGLECPPPPASRPAEPLSRVGVVLLGALLPPAPPAPAAFWFVGMGARADARTMPEIAPGLTLTGGLAHGPLWVTGEASGLATVARITGQPGRGAVLERFEGALRGCWAVGARAAVGPCGGFAAGALHGRGFGILRPSAATELWLAAQGGLGLRWRPRRGGLWWVNGDLVVPLARPRFELAGRPLFRPEVVGFALVVGTAAGFD